MCNSDIYEIGVIYSCLQKTHEDTHKLAVEPSLTCSEEMKRAAVREHNLWTIENHAMKRLAPLPKMFHLKFTLLAHLVQ